MPLPNLAIPPGARRGSASVGSADTSNATATTTAATAAVPENRPPAGIHSLSQEKIRFYMSLSDAQGQVLPPDQKQLWLWLKKLIAETKQQSANKQAAQTQQQRTSGPVRPGAGGAGQMTPGPYSGFRIPPAPGGLSMSNLNEEILKLYTGGKAPTMQQLRELCMRGGMNWSVQMENLMAPYASDRPKQQGSGVKLDPIEIPATPGASGGGVGSSWMAPRTTKEHIHENVRKVVELETGSVIDDDLVSVSTARVVACCNSAY